MQAIALLDDELFIKDNNMQIGETTDQNISLLCTVNKGEIKASPLRCVGAVNYLEDDSSDELTQEIRSELTIDGMKVKQISVTKAGIEINAQYE